MAGTIWWVLSILIALLVIGFIVSVIVFNKGKKHKTDYYAFFIMGITWAPFGLVFMTTVSRTIGGMFFIMGLVYMAIGLAHKKEWESRQVKWSKLSKKDRVIRTLALILLGLVVIIGLVFYVMFR